MEKSQISKTLTRNYGRPTSQLLPYLVWFLDFKVIDLVDLVMEKSWNFIVLERQTTSIGLAVHEIVLGLLEKYELSIFEHL